MATKRKTKKWVAVVGLNIKNARYEAGDTVPNPPKWMKDQGKVEEVK